MLRHYNNLMSGHNPKYWNCCCEDASRETYDIIHHTTISSHADSCDCHHCTAWTTLPRWDGVIDFGDVIDMDDGADDTDGTDVSEIDDSTDDNFDY